MVIVITVGIDLRAKVVRAKKEEIIRQFNEREIEKVNRNTLRQEKLDSTKENRYKIQ